MLLKWWQEPVRMLREDYTPEFANVKNEDFELLVKSRKEDWQINCEWIVGTPGFAGKGYLTTFKADGFNCYPGFENFDYLRSYTPYAHKYGIHVLSYLNLHWYDFSFADQHQEWEQVQSDGQRYGRVHPLYGNGTTFCVNSSWRQWAFRLIAEAMKTGIDGVFLDGPVIFPDCCTCPACQEQFKIKYGRAIPKEDWQDPAWQKFLDFREDSMARFLADAQKAVRQVNPEGVIFLNASDWSPGGWRVARDNQKVAPYQTFNGSEAFYYYSLIHDTYATLMTAKYLRAVDIPAVLFTHYMNGSWHYLNLPPNEMKLAMVQTLAANVNPWLAFMNPSVKSQPQSSRAVGEIFGFQEKNKEYFIETKSVAEVGLLFSKRTGRTYISKWDELYETIGMDKEENLVVDPQGKKIVNPSAKKRECESLLFRSFEGYFQALTRAHILFDIVLDRQITEENLSRFKTFILPDGACLSKEEVAVLKNYVQRGGNLVASFEAGFYDEDGQYSENLFDLLGIETAVGTFPVMTGENYSRMTQEVIGLKSDNLIERGPYALKVKTRPDVQTPGYFLEPIPSVYMPLTQASPFPSMIVNNYGRGRVIYFPEAIGYFYGNCKMLSAENRIAQSVKTLTAPSIMDVDAPKTISVELYRQENSKRLILHLVNNTVDGRPVSEFLPVRDIAIRLHLEGKPKKVYSLRESKQVEWSFNENTLHMSKVNIAIYEVIVVEL